VKLLGSNYGKACGEIEAHLVAEDAKSARSCAVFFPDALVKDMFEIS
jgi:hypothetical protein